MDVTTYSYQQYLLGIDSEFPLPDLSEEPGDADVRILLHPTLTAPLPFNGHRHVEFRSDIAYHCWSAIGCFLVEHGRRILVRPANGVDPRLLGHFISRIAFASVLHQRDLIVLHGSAVAVDSDVIAILGATGAGKSALAAALHRIGCQVLADDVLVIEDRDGTPYVRPASHHLHIWPAVAVALGYEESLRRVVDAETKLVVPSRPAWPSRAMPLRLVVQIVADETVGISIVPPAEAWREVADNSFINHIAGDRVETEAFDGACRWIASKVPCVRLKRRDVALEVRDLAKLVLTHACAA